jgi:hypothetical protein
MNYYTCFYSKLFTTTRLKASQLILASSQEAAEAMFRRSKIMPVIRSVRLATQEEVEQYLETYGAAHHTPPGFMELAGAGIERPVIKFVALVEPDVRK